MGGAFLFEVICMWKNAIEIGRQMVGAGRWLTILITLPIVILYVTSKRVDKVNKG